jgi:hypothetical protein
MGTEQHHPGFLSDDVRLGDRVQIVLPDGTSHEAVILARYGSGAVQLDYTNEGAVALAEAKRARGVVDR